MATAPSQCELMRGSSVSIKVQRMLQWYYIQGHTPLFIPEAYPQKIFVRENMDKTLDIL